MQPGANIPPYSPALRGQVIVLSAPHSPARSERMAAWVDAARATGAAAWLVSCDTGRAGLWAGLNTWLEAVLREIERDAPDLLARHDAELVAVLPALARRVTRRHVPLTESAPLEEATRNYAGDRAYRLGHGIIDLLDEWSARSGRRPWVLACDDFDRRGALVGRFFRELVRRRGETLGLTLLAAAEPENADAVAASFAPGTPVVPAALDIDREPAERPDARSAAREALELEERVRAGEIDAQVHVHQIVRLWTEAGDVRRATWWTSGAVPTLNHLGYYEDALPFAERLEASLADFAPAWHPVPRWNVAHNVYNTYIAVGLAERAHALLANELELTTDPRSRARTLYALAMLHARHLPKRDLALAEDYLNRGLAALDEADLTPADRHFTRVFLLNGLALVRHRQGDAAAAIDISRSGFERLNEALPPEKHRLHRSVLLYNAAQVYAATGAYDDAIASLSAAMEMDPGYSEYYNERGNLYLRRNRYAEALADYRAAVDRSSPYPEVWLNMGQCLSAMRQLDEAVDAYSRAIDLDPARKLAVMRRAQVLGQMGRREEALADYDAALALDPAHPLAYANRAAIRFELGRTDEALADLDRAVGLAPEVAGLRRNRAMALTALGRHAEAARELEAYLRLDPSASDRAEVEAQLASVRVAA
ncbi:MAG TPA: tetratricopeptide repeat protein [Longimicrobiaceae bacterium]|jgi:tetratricopeptide (TPR) repeat protein|nr:tetratricopeptide repeat protein [Longimicrobiaceae bacterium]